MMDYPSHFFERIGHGSRSSADVIVPLCQRWLHPTSVVDVGCGSGEWLAAFRTHGIEDILGLDGHYVDPQILRIPPAAFRPIDLESRFTLDRTFDLAISLEVAEHLSKRRGPTFVADLVALAPAVLFSAAIPRQGGTSHVNERWQDYWASHFRNHGYSANDCIRPAIWEDERVERWYAQNAILYTDASVQLDYSPVPFPLRVVHPDLFRTLGSSPDQLTIREASKQLLPSVSRAVRWNLERLHKTLRDR